MRAVGRRYARSFVNTEEPAGRSACHCRNRGVDLGVTAPPATQDDRGFMASRELDTLNVICERVAVLFESRIEAF
jgi:hypothetical protein